MHCSWWVYTLKIDPLTYGLKIDVYDCVNHGNSCFEKKDIVLSFGDFYLPRGSWVSHESDPYVLVHVGTGSKNEFIEHISEWFIFSKINIGRVLDNFFKNMMYLQLRSRFSWFKFTRKFQMLQIFIPPFYRLYSDNIFSFGAFVFPVVTWKTLYCSLKKCTIPDRN